MKRQGKVHDYKISRGCRDLIVLYAAANRNPSPGCSKMEWPRTSGISLSLHWRCAAVLIFLPVWVTTLWCLKVWAVAHPLPERSAWPGTASGRQARVSSSRASWRRLHKNLPASDLWASSTLKRKWSMLT